MFLVFNYDYLKLTALHWAARRNNINTAIFLINNNSYTNSCDCWGRTPVFYAITNKNEIMTYLLLKHNGDPWSTRGCDYKEMSEGNEMLLYLIKKFRFLDLILKFMKKD